LNSLLIERFSADERKRIGVHSCPGGGRRSTRSAGHSKDGQRIFVGVIDPIDPRVERPQEAGDRMLEAAGHVAPERLGTTDDCRFAPFSDDTSRSRETVFAKIRSRVSGTALAAKILSAKILGVA
jgi:5-methyltetrahydropteroyltriglutamate--homocysteine methyltransferase